MRIVRAGVSIAAVAFAVQSAAGIAGFFWFDGTVDQLNADAELTVWSWASSTATACAALAAALFAVAQRKHRGTYVFLVATLTFFSADDMLQIHERVTTDLGGASETARIVWPIVYLPLLVASFVLLWRRSAGAPGPATRCVHFGLFMLAAAVGFEVASFAMVQIGLDSGTVAYELEAIVEEGLELAAWILIASGLIAGFLDQTTNP